MGHIRLGRLPRYHRWQNVLDALASPGVSADTVASATMGAASTYLRAASREPGCYLPLMVLSRAVVAARSEMAFGSFLDQMRIGADDQADGLRLLAALARAAEAESRPSPVRTVLTDISNRALQEVLLSRVRSASESLWGIDAGSVRSTLKEFSTSRGYSELVRDWFARFVGRSLQYFIDRELSNNVGEDAAVPTSGAAVEFESEVLAYALERTRIIRDYAPGWLSKTLWEKKQLTEESSRSFFAYCVKKILDDMSLEPRH